MMFATILQASLTDAPASSVIGAAAGWITDLLFGPLATTIAIIAIAWVGLAMLSGRIEIRRGFSVVLGCFLLFGAKGIADGLRASTPGEGVYPTTNNTAQPDFGRPNQQGKIANGFDPYAGASVTRPVE